MVFRRGFYFSSTKGYCININRAMVGNDNYCNLTAGIKKPRLVRTFLQLEFCINKDTRVAD